MVIFTRLFKMPISTPMLYCLSDCHFKLSFALLAMFRETPSPPKLYRRCAEPEGNSWLPVIPQPPRNLRLLIRPALKKLSLLMTHAPENEGKYPYLLSAPNLDEPSARIVPVTRNLSS